MSNKKDKSSKKAGKKAKLLFCSKKDCQKASDELYEAFKKEVDKRGLKDAIKLKREGCIGVCEKQPATVLKKPEMCFLKLKEQDVGRVITEALKAVR